MDGRTHGALGRIAGLHRFDGSLARGDLVELVRAQGAAYVQAHPAAG